MLTVISKIKNIRQTRKLERASRCEVEAAMARRACYIVASARYFEQGDRASAARMMRLAEGELALSRALRRRE